MTKYIEMCMQWSLGSSWFMFGNVDLHSPIGLGANCPTVQQIKESANIPLFAGCSRSAMRHQCAAACMSLTDRKWHLSMCLCEQAD